MNQKFDTKWAYKVNIEISLLIKKAMEYVARESDVRSDDDEIPES